MIRRGENYHIAVVINARYLIHMFTMLCSLFLTNREKRFIVYILYSDLKAEHKHRIKTFFRRFHQRYTLIEVEPDLFGNAPVLNPNMSKEAYYKLLLPIQLPEHIDRVLYLDSDIIINGKIDGLYKCSLDGNAFAAVEYNMDREMEYKMRLMGPEDAYFNSGVLLLDMIKLREIYDWESVCRYIEEEGKNFYCHDQEVLNALFHKNVKIVDETYNYLTMYRDFWDLWDLLAHRRNRNARKIHVIHYANNDNKPWMPLYRGKFLSYYWKYRRFLYGDTEYRKFQVKRLQLMPVRLYKMIKDYFVPEMKHCIYSKRHERKNG